MVRSYFLFLDSPFTKAYTILDKRICNFSPAFVANARPGFCKKRTRILVLLNKGTGCESRTRSRVKCAVLCCKREAGALLRKQVTGPSDRNRAGKAGRPASADFRRNTQVRRPTEGTTPALPVGGKNRISFFCKSRQICLLFFFSLRVPSVVLLRRTTGRASLGRANGYGQIKEKRGGTQT